MKVTDGCLLYLLWQKRRNDHGAYVSAEELREELVAGRSGTTFHADLRIGSVKKSLVKLEKDLLLESKPVPKPPGSKPGPDPKGYRFLVGAPVISWRSTAHIVLKLYNDGRHDVELETFVSELLALELIQEETLRPATAEDIHRQLEYCVKHEYIEKKEISVDTPGGQRTELCLSVTDRVHTEMPFLGKLIEEPKPQASAVRDEFSDSSAKSV